MPDRQFTNFEHWLGVSMSAFTLGCAILFAAMDSTLIAVVTASLATFLAYGAGTVRGRRSAGAAQGRDSEVEVASRAPNIAAEDGLDNPLFTTAGGYWLQLLAAFVVVGFGALSITLLAAGEVLTGAAAGVGAIAATYAAIRGLTAFSRRRRAGAGDAISMLAFGISVAASAVFILVVAAIALASDQRRDATLLVIGYGAVAFVSILGAAVAKRLSKGADPNRR